MNLGLHGVVDAEERCEFKDLLILHKIVIPPRLRSLLFGCLFSCLFYFRAAPGKGRAEFEGSISSLFSSIVKMMKISSSEVLLLQVPFLGYIPGYL